MSKAVYRPPKLNKNPFGPFAGSMLLALLIFLALPLTQLLSGLQNKANVITTTEINIPPPDAPPPEPPPPEEEEVKEDKPELQEDLQPISLDQLEVALNPGVGDSLSTANASLDFGMTPNVIGEMIFELKDLDNNPRRIVAVPPVYPFQFKREGIQGSVRLIIIIDERGNVVDAKVQRATHKEFVKPAIDAVLQWKFEPGKKNGKPVKVRRLQPISFKLT